jgi:hypothetical protein
MPNTFDMHLQLKVNFKAGLVASKSQGTVWEKVQPVGSSDYMLTCFTSISLALLVHSLCKWHGNFCAFVLLCMHLLQGKGALLP